MKRFTLFLLLLFVTSMAHAQVTRQVPANVRDLQDWARQPRVLAEQPNVDVEGSPYYNEDWITGHVQIDKETKSGPVKLRYSNYTNEVVFQEDGKIMALQPNALIGFTLLDGDRRIEFRKGFRSKEHDIQADRLMRIIYDGSTKLIAKEYNYLHKDEDPFTGKMEYDFIPKTDFFIVTSGGSYHKVNLKKKDILRALSGDRDELEAYAESQDLDFDEEEDLKRLLAHYDESTGGQ